MRIGPLEKFVRLPLPSPPGENGEIKSERARARARGTPLRLLHAFRIGVLARARDWEKTRPREKTNGK